MAQGHVVHGRDDEEHGVGADVERFPPRVRVGDEVLAEGRQQGGLARFLQVLDAAAEELLFREHGERGRARHLVGLRDLGRVQVLAQDAARGGAALELPDDVGLSGPGERGRERAVPAGLGDEGGGIEGALLAPLGHALARAGQDARQHADRLHARETSTTRRRRASARPSSTARPASATPARRSFTRPATRRAAAALSSTTSRVGPRPPSSTRRAMSAFARASPPWRAGAGQGSSPASSGRTVNVRISRPSNEVTRVGPHKDISSIPDPWTTHARATPSRRRQPARNSVSSGRGTPTICADGTAGLVRGPRRLKAVRIPSSFRGPTAWRVEAWKPGAKRKVQPTSSRQRWTTSTGASIRTSSASSTSALPQLPLAERLPCLATGTPQAATTSEATVEMLKVPAPSPPVPQVSTAPFAVSGTARARIVRANPTISSSVSPRTAIPTSRAPIWAGVASPSMMIAMAEPASCSVSRSPRAILARNGFMTGSAKRTETGTETETGSGSRP